MRCQKGFANRPLRESTLRPWRAMQRSAACSFVLVAAALATVHAETALPFPAAAKLAGFEAQVRQQMDADRTTGLSLAFQIGDSVWARGFGFADVENQVPATPRSSYRTASITKAMTASAILQLSEQGKIDLDAEIQTYVPYFPRKPHPVTVRQLLSHLGGITHYKNRDVELHIKEHKNTRETLAIFQDYDLVVEPGTKYSYSTYGYNLLGAAIEGVSGQSYGDYMREHLWAPLGMLDTCMDDPTRIIENRVRGYRLIDRQLANSEFVDVSSRFAGGGTRTTVLDLLKFARGYQEGRVVAPASVDQMTAPGVTRDGRATYYGMGWDIFPMNGHYMTSHSGGQNETRTLVFSLPRLRCALALATNFESADISVYAKRLAQVVLGELWDTLGGTATYSGDAVSAVRLTNMRQAFGFGLYQFEKGGPLVRDDAKLQQAFAYFNSCMERRALEKDRTATLEKIEAGRWPANGEAAVAVGSFMASKLQERLGGEHMEGYHFTNAIPFFHDYVELYRSAPGFPPALRFSAEVEKQLARWNKDWAKTCTPAIRSLVVAPFVDTEALERTLRQAFSGAVVYPDFSEALAGATAQHMASGAAERALQTATLSHAFYPESPMACRYLAVAQLGSGDDRQARSLLRKAVAAGDPDIAGPGVFRNQAYDLFHWGKGEAAVEWLRLSIELYPSEANLYDALGDLCSETGQKEEAIAAYSKALEIDPAREATRKALAELRTTAR